MDMPRNTFKHAIAKGQLQIGLWCSLCSPVAIEVVSLAEDWLDRRMLLLCMRSFAQLPAHIQRFVEHLRADL